ncbi:MAG: FHA domain-containing protein [Planctomycetota bacterium]|jgi:pSer/pThr/pTyr-binding forkhead associated (FHA) protein
MELKLVVIKGKHKGLEVPIKKTKFFIGRAEDCHLRPKSEMISRHHCAILVEDGIVAVRDFGSRNGTFVNGEQVEGGRELKNGDLLKVGNLEFEVQLTVRIGGKMKPKVESVEEAAARTVESSVIDEDLDLDQWLGDTDELESAPTKVDDTTITPAQAPPNKKANDQQEVPTKVVGVFGKGRWKPTSTSPRDAAAESLRNFFGR